MGQRQLDRGLEVTELAAAVEAPAAEAVGIDRLTLQQSCDAVGQLDLAARTLPDALQLFEADPETEGVLMMGEIGGTAEEEASAYIKANVKKPVVGFIAGQTAPPGRRMGHAGAIIAGGSGKASDKIEAMEAAGITICQSPAEIGEKIQSRL